MLNEATQRALFACLLNGKLGLRSAGLSPGFFTEHRHPLGVLFLDYHTRNGKWPTVDVANYLLSSADSEIKSEFQTIASLPPEVQEAAIPGIREVLKKAALNIASLKLGDIADGPSSAYWKAGVVVDEALRAGEPDKPPFDYSGDPALRHTPESFQNHFRVATAIPSLDAAMNGGLAAGEIGLILGLTGVGKSHASVWFGSRHLLKNGRVIHVTLELRDLLCARRYDRAITGMTAQEILADPGSFRAKHQSLVSEPGRLSLHGFPRFGLTVAGVGNLVRRKLDEWGEPALVLVDYGAILRPEKPDARHQEIGRIHEALSSLAQTENVPIWTPFQSNRQALIQSGGAEVSVEHAGDSYEAVQHADCILSLCQTKEEEHKKRARFNIVKARETTKGVVFLSVNWATSTVQERDLAHELA